MGRWIKLFILFISICFLSGCTFKDIDNRFMVVAIGLDKGQVRQYNVTLKLIIPTKEVIPGNSNYQLLSQEADSISEAIELMSASLDKQLYLGHAKVTIFGESLSENITQHIDWFVRRRGIQRIEYLALGRPTAREILALNQKSERLAGNSLIKSFDKEGGNSSFVIPSHLYQFYDRILEQGKDPFLPIVKVQENGKDTYEINQVSLFDKDKKVLELNPLETRIFKILLMKESHFEIMINENEYQYSLSVQQMKYKYKIFTPVEEAPFVHMKVKIKGTAEESKHLHFTESTDEIEKITKRSIERSITELLVKMKNSHIDPLGFGLRYIATRHEGDQDYENWVRKVYPNLNFQVEVDFQLESTGEVD